VKLIAQITQSSRSVFDWQLYCVRVTMKKQVSQPDYGPNEWDFDFSFDLDLSITDYLFLGFYLIFIAPIAFISGLVHSLYCKLKDSLNGPVEQQKIQKPTHGRLSMISKFQALFCMITLRCIEYNLAGISLWTTQSLSYLSN